MKRLCISVEGQTESEFCREVLRPHLRHFGVELHATILTTKRVIGKPHFKGGSVSLDRVIAEVRRLLPAFDHVTTLYDFYGFQDRNPDETADDLLVRMRQKLGDPPLFTPYVQVYEFEALIFSAPDIVGQYMRSADLARELESILAAAPNPESINDHPESCPSARLRDLFGKHLKRRYDKVLDGPVLTLEISLERIRKACPRFHGWLAGLERMGHE